MSTAKLSKKRFCRKLFCNLIFCLSKCCPYVARMLPEASGSPTIQTKFKIQAQAKWWLDWKKITRKVSLLKISCVKIRSNMRFDFSRAVYHHPMHFLFVAITRTCVQKMIQPRSFSQDQNFHLKALNQNLPTRFCKTYISARLRAIKRIKTSQASHAKSLKQLSTCKCNWCVLWRHRWKPRLKKQVWFYPAQEPQTAVFFLVLVVTESESN